MKVTLCSSLAVADGDDTSSGLSPSSEADEKTLGARYLSPRPHASNVLNAQSCQGGEGCNRNRRPCRHVMHLVGSLLFGANMSRITAESSDGVNAGRRKPHFAYVTSMPAAAVHISVALIFWCVQGPERG